MLRVSARLYIIYILIFKQNIMVLTFNLGTIQVLRQHVFDLFRPTHPPYQQMSAFLHTYLKHDVSISSYPPIPTHPPIYKYIFAL